MKKLTAGIFATILGLTAVDAFAAVPTGRYNVASVKYVNEAMNAVSGNVSGLETRVTANETAINTLNGEQDTQDAAIKAAADAAAAAQGEVDALEVKVGTVPEGTTVVKMIEDAQSEATYDDTEVTGRLDAIEAEQITQNTNITNAANAAAAAATAAANAETNAKAYTDAEIGEIGDMTVKAYVDAAKSEASYDDTEVTGRLDAIEAEQITQNTNITNAANAAQAADIKAQKAQNELEALDENVNANYVAWADVDDSYVANEYTF